MIGGADPILLVEDNDDDIELTRRAFTRGHLVNELIVVRDGQEALDYLMATGPYAHRDALVLPRVVLLDLNLPKINGLEVLRRIRSAENTKLLPVVILTTSREERDITGSYSLGANSYVRKPVDFSEFLEMAQRLSEYWLTFNEPASPPGRLS